MTKSRSRLAAMWKPVVLVVIVAGLMAAARVFELGDRLKALRELIEDAGAWGPLLFIAVYTTATVLAIPGTVLTVGAGALFGSAWGVVFVSIGSTLGATCCFLISRYFARDTVSKWLESNERFHRLDELSASQGAAIVAITRLVPLFPFNLLNYGFGLTGVRFGSYLFWSWLCMLPGTILYVVGADVLFKSLAEGKAPWPLVAVVAGVVVFLVVVVRKARGRLKDSEEQGGGA